MTMVQRLRARFRVPAELLCRRRRSQSVVRQSGSLTELKH
jgi:hypothetical protein